MLKMKASTPWTSVIRRMMGEVSLYVRDLRSHADDERVVGEVHVVGVVPAGKHEAARVFAPLPLVQVVAARVVKRKDGLDQEPRRRQRDDRQREMPGFRPEREILDRPHDEADGHHACAGRAHHEQEDDVAARVLRQGVAARRFRVCNPDDRPGNGEVDERARIPARDEPRVPGHRVRLRDVRHDSGHECRSETLLRAEVLDAACKCVGGGGAVHV